MFSNGFRAKNQISLYTYIQKSGKKLPRVHNTIFESDFLSR